MCEVIALTPRRVARTAPVDGSAEILFFMGVRYQRMSDVEFEKATVRKPAKRKASTRRTVRRQA